MRLTLDVMAEPLAVCRLDAGAPVPAWATAAPFYAVARTADELSVVCAEARVPDGVTASRGWRALQLRGPFPCELVGVLLAVAAPLAEAGVSIMPIATYDTDYVLVREGQLAAALAALGRAGHTVHREDA